MSELTRFVHIEFRQFKAFERFAIDLRQFNILVGPNNSGKSTILTAFRILAAGMRRAAARKPTLISGPDGRVQGYVVDLTALSVAEENIFHDYDESIPATVTFYLANGSNLLLYFPERSVCNLIADMAGKHPQTPAAFRSHFNCPIGFVPILGPVEHNENIYEKEAARLALFSYRAARNFRNIWFHYPDKFEEFRTALIETWPGMDIQRPELDYSHDKPRLHMFCPEERMPRELFWAGFGFQVWCQMLTHLIQSSDTALFLIDEPDIYLHSDLQRQLLALLRNLGPDILIATHSTEIISEAETDDIVVISKHRKKAKRIRQPSQLEGVFSMLGSNLNPVLTQLAKTRKVVFVEGKDFQILAKFARKLGSISVANRSDFAVVPVEGFNPDRVRSTKLGIEATLGGKITVAMILDKDYRSAGEREKIVDACSAFCDYIAIHKCKEIENFLLVPEAIDRATVRKLVERGKRTGNVVSYTAQAEHFLKEFATEKRSYVLAQYLAYRRKFERTNSPKLDEATVNESALKEFDEAWKNELNVIPGKDALSALNELLQNDYSVGITHTSIIEAMHADEVPSEVVELVNKLAEFASN